MTIIAVPKILRDKLTDEGADALVQLIDRVEDRTQKVVLEMSEEKFERRVAQLEGTMDAKFGELKGSFQAQMAHLEFKMDAQFSQIDTRIAQSQAETIRWTFAFVMGQFWAIVGTLFIFFRK